MIGIIGGTGLSAFLEANLLRTERFESRFGAPSSEVSICQLHGRDFAFLPRHGHPHRVPPHKINYRANLDVLVRSGVTELIAVNAVGGICEGLGPAQIAIPDQILDYTYGREHTIYDDGSALDHVDFSFPYSGKVRENLASAASRANISVLTSAVYAATQGPRLETAAEISKIRRDGADMVGMTGMPEAALAREMAVEYACIALSVNWAAGLTDELITMHDIEEALAAGMKDVKKILACYIQG